MKSDNGGLTPLARAEALIPKIAAAADEIDARRELPAALADAMKDAGLFRLLVPRSVGGEEMEWLDYLDVVRTVAYADGSTGWCLNQGAVFATTCCRAPEALAEEVWGDPRTVIGNGPPQGGIDLEHVKGGYQLSGRWRFSSGCRHANWIAAVSGGRRPAAAAAFASPGRDGIPGRLAGQRLARHRQLQLPRREPLRLRRAHHATARSERRHLGSATPHGRPYV